MWIKHAYDKSTGGQAVVRSVFYTAAVKDYQWENYHRLVEWTSERRHALIFTECGLDEENHLQILACLSDRDESLLEKGVAGQAAHISRLAEFAAHEPRDNLRHVYEYLLFDHLTHHKLLADKLSRAEGLSPLAQAGFHSREGRPLADQEIQAKDIFKQPYDRRHCLPLSRVHTRLALAQELALRAGYRWFNLWVHDGYLAELFRQLALIEDRHIAMIHSLFDPYETTLEYAYIGELAETACFSRALEDGASEPISRAFKTALEGDRLHLEKIGGLIYEDEGRSASALSDPAPVLEPLTDPDRVIEEVAGRQPGVLAAGTSFTRAA